MPTRVTSVCLALVVCVWPTLCLCGFAIVFADVGVLWVLFRYLCVSWWMVRLHLCVHLCVGVEVFCRCFADVMLMFCRCCAGFFEVCKGVL